MNRRQMARELGRQGGRARAARLSADARRRIASLGGMARARSFQAARRVEQNLRYSAVIRELQTPSAPVKREHSFAGRLPGLYRDET